MTGEQALEQAHALERELMEGRSRGPLHGIPLGLKDNIDTAGVLTTAGSGVYAGRVPTKDARVVTLLRDAGVVFLGKLNMHEFGFGATGVVTHYGPMRNPWDLDYIPGGSSSGSAAAVAARMCAAALGTDTAGSIRVPAAYCGVAPETYYQNVDVLVWDLARWRDSTVVDADASGGLGSNVGVSAQITLADIDIRLHDLAAADIVLQTVKLDPADPSNTVMSHFVCGRLAAEAGDIAEALTEMEAFGAMFGDPAIRYT